MSIDNLEKIHFPGLNSLRAIAALTVVIGHIELNRESFGLSNHMNLAFFATATEHLGVILFFVLSGFLITFLLIKERDLTSHIDWKKFYMRRILRIWPIYYLMIFLAVTVLSFNNPAFNSRFYVRIFLSLLFLPNVCHAFRNIGGYVDAPQLWSIGVEEQFYILWPLIVRTFRKSLYFILIFIFLFITFIPHVFDYFSIHILKGNINSGLKAGIDVFLYGFKINSMSIGGLGALIYNDNRKKILSVIYNPIVEISVFLVTFLLIVFGFHTTYSSDEFYSVLFILIILNVSTNKSCLISLNNKILDYLGKISYGIYVYHWIIIELLLYLIRKYRIITNTFFDDIIIYTAVIGFTIFVSYLSYELFEKRFLKMKTRYTIIKSE